MTQLDFLKIPINLIDLLRYIPIWIRKNLFPDLYQKDYPCFVIKGQFPSLNEYLAACGKNPRAGSRMKKQYMEMAAWEIRSQLKGFHTDKKIILHYRIYEPNMKRDKDNVFCMISKCVSDALQVCKVIDNDGWKNIENFTHDFYIDKDNPRTEVYIEEILN